MPEIIADPDELDDLARELEAFSQQTREHLARINARVKELGATSWRDARYQEFEGEFDRALVAMHLSLDGLDPEQSTWLRGLAERLRTYL